MNLNQTPLVSVVIPTYNREDILCKTIDSVLEQEYPNFEILVIDQTKKHLPETDEYLKKLDSENKIRLIKLSKPGVPGARNAGVVDAKGDIIIFNDDDVHMRKEHIKKYVKYFQNPEVVAIAAKIDNHPPISNRYAYKCKDPVKNWWYFNFDSNQKGFSAGPAGSSMGFRKKVLKEIGGFDKNLINESWGEETDVGFRLRKKGYKVNYEPEITVDHYMHPTGGSRTANKDVTLNLSFYRNVIYFFLKNLSLFSILPHMILAYRYFACREKEDFLKNPQALKRFFIRNFKYFTGATWGLGVYLKYLSGNREQL